MTRSGIDVPAVDVRRGADRVRTRTDWLDSRHSFSFGAHYDPADTHFGLLLVSNDDRVEPGAGFDTHPHRDTEIVTWVLEGSLVHQDSTGHAGVLHPGLAQRMSAGTGILHSERADAGADDAFRAEPAAPRTPVRFVQMWVLPDAEGVEPGYEQLDIGAELATGAPVVVASGMRRYATERAISIRQRDAALHAVRLRPAAATHVPAAPHVHVFVARGSADLEGAGTLAEGDAARITASDGRRLTAGSDGAELLLWEMHTALV